LVAPKWPSATSNTTHPHRACFQRAFNVILQLVKNWIIASPTNPLADLGPKSARQRSEPRNVRLDRPVRRRRCGLTAAQHQNGSRAGPRVLASGEWCWGNTEHIKGWDIKEDGFSIVLSPELPALMKKALARRLMIFSNATDLCSATSTVFCFIPAAANCCVVCS